MLTYDALRRQYRKNATEQARMIQSGKYRGRVLAQLAECQARAERCAEMSDSEMDAHLAECRAAVSTQLAQMIAR